MNEQEICDACKQRKSGFTDVSIVDCSAQSFWRTASTELSYSTVQLPGYLELLIRSESFKQSSRLWSMCSRRRTFRQLKVKGMRDYCSNRRDVCMSIWETSDKG